MTIRRLAGALSAAFLALGGPGLHAQELSALYGGTQTTSFKQANYSYQVDYRQDFTENFAASLGWLNEGHITTHKRDGYAFEGWFSLPLANDHFSISAGAGLYDYFDTQRQGANGSVDVHGNAPIYSLTATYYTDDRWFARFVLNEVIPSHDIHVSNTASVGVGYWLGRGDRPKKGNFGDPPAAGIRDGERIHRLRREERREHLLRRPHLCGRGRVPPRPPTPSRRHGLLHLRGGSAHDAPQRRRPAGLAGQRLQQRPLHGRDGLWPLCVDRPEEHLSGEGYHAPAISPLVSPTFSVRLSDLWVIRGVFNRVVSQGQADSDVFLLGLGLRWR